MGRTSLKLFQPQANDVKYLVAASLYFDRHTSSQDSGDKSNETQFDLKRIRQKFGQRSDQIRVGHVAYNLIRSDETSILLVPCLFVYHTWLKSYRQKNLFYHRLIMGAGQKLT